MDQMRILSLLPAATEIVYLLGLEKYLVGVSLECDYPPQAKEKIKVTFSEISNSMSSGQIDERIKGLLHKGAGIFHIKKDKLKLLKPNLIITQELCRVCAIPFTQVQKAARILDGEVKIVSLEPESLEDILENIRIIGEYGGRKKEAVRVVRELKKRLKIYDLRFKNIKKKPKVLVVEWLQPTMVAGHWVPEMVELAGGKMMLIQLGEKSRKINPVQEPLNPDIVIISPCGFDIRRTLKEKDLILKIIREIGEVRGGVYLVDGNAYMTRPGPRIVDGVEILSEIIHPEIYPRRYTKRDWIEFKL